MTIDEPKKTYSGFYSRVRELRYVLDEAVERNLLQKDVHYSLSWNLLSWTIPKVGYQPSGMPEIAMAEWQKQDLERLVDGQ
jgi:hypothetical protein